MSVREVVGEASVPPSVVGEQGAIVAKPRAQRVGVPLAWGGSPAVFIVLAIDDSRAAPAAGGAEPPARLPQDHYPILFVGLVQALALRFSLPDTALAVEVHSLMPSIAKRAARVARGNFGFIDNPVIEVATLEQPMRTTTFLEARRLCQGLLGAKAWTSSLGLSLPASGEDFGVVLGRWGEGAARRPDNVVKLSKRVAAALLQGTPGRFIRSLSPSASPGRAG